MNEKQAAGMRLKEVETAVLDDLINRVQDIDNSYRAVAEKVGQFYMLADEHKLARLTGQLDKPMRNASENEQAFAALLDDLRMQRNQRK
jgi:hypothetical protein